MVLQAAFEYHMTGTQELLPDHLDEPIPLKTWEVSLQTYHNMSLTVQTSTNIVTDVAEHTSSRHADEV